MALTWTGGQPDRALLSRTSTRGSRLRTSAGVVAPGLHKTWLILGRWNGKRVGGDPDEPSQRHPIKESLWLPSEEWAMETQSPTKSNLIWGWGRGRCLGVVPPLTFATPELRGRNSTAEKCRVGHLAEAESTPNTNKIPSISSGRPPLRIWPSADAAEGICSHRKCHNLWSVVTTHRVTVPHMRKSRRGCRLSEGR